MIRDMNYSEAIEEFGQELAAALLEEEYNQFICNIEPAPADFYSFKTDENYIDDIESIGIRRIRANNEILYRMEEGF